MDSGKQQIKQMKISKHVIQTHKCNLFKHTLFQSSCDYGHNTHTYLHSFANTTIQPC